HWRRPSAASNWPSPTSAGRGCRSGDGGGGGLWSDSSARRGEEGWMAQDQRQSTSREADPPSDAPRVKVVACLGGVSLERGVPAGEIHDYIHEPDNVVWVDVQDPGPVELAMLIDEFGVHPLALEGAAHGQRRPKVDEFKGYL